MRTLTEADLMSVYKCECCNNFAALSCSFLGYEAICITCMAEKMDQTFDPKFDEEFCTEGFIFENGVKVVLSTNTENLTLIKDNITL